jgi:outer membrane protein insertion porin family
VEQPQAPLLAIKFEGLKSLSESDMLKALRDERAMISSASAGDPAQVKRGVDVIKEALKARGYRQAMVEARLDEAAQPTGSVTFIVREGAQSRITGIEFKGNTIFTDEQLLKVMNYTLRKNRAKLPQIDAVYDKDSFEFDLRLVQQAMTGQGYLKARTGEPQIEETGDTLKIIIPVDEGARYRIGEIKVEGATQFSTAEILDFLRLKPGDIAAGGEIGGGLFERLKRAYGDRGYIQYEASPEPTFREAAGGREGVVDFTIVIDEGRRFRIRTIRFEGNALTHESVLRDALALRDGEVYNQTKFEEGLKRIEQLGIAAPIDPMGGVDYRTNEEEGLLDIIIRVRELEGR